jgi:hypothetical protein
VIAKTPMLYRILQMLRLGMLWTADPEFAWDTRIVRLGLSTDGFHPYSSDCTTYFC